MSTKFIAERWLDLHGFTVEEFAQGAGIGLGRARKLAQGKVWPTCREACAIRDLMKLPLDHWIPEDPPPL